MPCRDRDPFPIRRGVFQRDHYVASKGEVGPDRGAIRILARVDSTVGRAPGARRPAQPTGPDDYELAWGQIRGWCDCGVADGRTRSRELVEGGHRSPPVSWCVPHLVYCAVSTRRIMSDPQEELTEEPVPDRPVLVQPAKGPQLKEQTRSADHAHPSAGS